MPLDPSFVPALEEELRMAKQVKPGGQEPRPDRIAAIEEQIRLHRAGDKKARGPQKENADAEPAEPANKRAAKENADAKATDVETTQA